MRAVFKSQQDTSELDRIFKETMGLEKNTIEYGFFDDPHYSGLNTATLAAIHQEGWNNLPVRNFMTSADILFREEDLLKYTVYVMKAIIDGRGVNAALRKMANAAANRIQWVINYGQFSNNQVSAEWAARKGFSEAMYHYNDLVNSVRFKIGGV